MTFIITNKDGSRTQYSNHYDEDDENLYKEHWKNKNLIDEFVKFNGEEIY